MPKQANSKGLSSYNNILQGALTGLTSSASSNTLYRSMSLIANCNFSPWTSPWLIVIYVATILPTTEACEACVTLCTKGTYCVGDSCRPCPDRTFQNKNLHSDGDCKPWTFKSESDGWVLSKKGTSTSDNKWSCMEGWVEYTYAHGESTCKPATSDTTVSDRTPPDSAPTKNTNEVDGSTKKKTNGESSGANRVALSVLSCILTIITSARP